MKSRKKDSTAWNEIYLNCGHIFREPHPKMQQLFGALEDLPGKRFLDIGCGTGRHLILAYRFGLKVIGLDNSSEALRLTEKWFESEGGVAELHCVPMTQPFPVADRSIAVIAAVQSIHHAVTADIQVIVREIDRVSYKGTMLFLSVPTRRNQGAAFRELESSTYVPLDGPEAGVPHHFFSEEEITDLIPTFQIQSMALDDSGHLCVIARRD